MHLCAVFIDFFFEILSFFCLSTEIAEGDKIAASLQPTPDILDPM